ncbi:MAG: ISAs1 family transposase [Acidobacteria bacterium]|nr:ISAs1 family transposase [Acidobacteriota bacterium]
MNITIGSEKNVKSVASIFAAMTDQRKPKGIRYQFQPLLILLSLSKLCLQDTPSEIFDWVTNRSSWLKEKLDLDWKRMPSLSTWQRLVAANIEVAEFDELVGQYFQTLSSGEQEFLNLDGKVLRRTVSEETQRQLHLLALQESQTNAVVEQTALAPGENEISAAKRLLEKADLGNKIVSGDAIFAQTELSRQVVEKGGEYLWKLRANQGQIYEMAKNHFAEMDDHYLGRASILEKEHGRIEEREILSSFRLAGKIEFPYLAQVFRIVRKSEEVKTGQRSKQTIYAITSLPVEEFGAAELLSLTRQHWSIENGLHYRRDVTFKEDQVQQKSLTGGRVLAVLNNLTIGILRKLGWENIAKARRHFSAMVDEALSLILFPIKPLL